MNLGLLRPGRFVAAHVGAVLVALAVGLATDHLLAALAAAGLLGLLAHVAEQARQRLRSDALERRYRQLVEDMPLSFYITSIDSNMEPLYVSPAIVDLLGYSLEEWKANPLLFEEIVHPLDSERVLRAIARAKAEMNPYEAEYRLYHKDGTVVWVQDRAVTVRDTRGGRFHWQGFLVDVTARKQAEARYRTLVEQLPLITYIDTPYSADEAASYVSPQIEEILGYSLEEWHANPSFFVEHLHPEDRERVREAQREARLNARAARARVPVHRGRRPRRLAERQLHGRARRDRASRGTRRASPSTSRRASRRSGTARRCSRRRRSRTNGSASSTG